MASKINTAPPRGMRDILPHEVELRDAAIQQILAVYRGYGFRRIETPALSTRRTSLIARVRPSRVMVACPAAVTLRTQSDSGPYSTPRMTWPSLTEPNTGVR